MTDVGGIAGDQLRSYIERIERLNEEEAALKEDKREVFAEAKGNGFDPKTMRQVIAARKLDPDDRAERETMFDLYMQAIEGSGTRRAIRAQARDAREAPATPHDPDTGEVIETAEETELPARDPGADDGRPSEPSPDEAPPAGVHLIGQSEQAIPVQSHAVRQADEPRPAQLEMPDIPDYLRRQKVVAG